MARKKPHEDHVNHEAWAIPYGDLLVLLLAFFVVMYAVSSVNEGKYRVLSDSLQEAFGGAPKSLKPVQIGSQQKGAAPEAPSNALPVRLPGSSQRAPKPSSAQSMPAARRPGEGAGAAAERRALAQMGREIEDALGELVSKRMVRVRNSEHALEVEIATDILYPSGSAQLSPQALPVLGTVADILLAFPNPMRIEGHTDALPINTALYPSNWELSAARASSVVHLFVSRGVVPQRMSVAGFGEFRPAASNDNVDGRNRNRRVVIAVLAREGETLPSVAGGAPNDTASNDTTSNDAASNDAATGGTAAETAAVDLPSLPSLPLAATPAVEMTP